MALSALFCTGFEHGVTPPTVSTGLGFSTVTGSPTIVAAAARNGGFGFRSATTTATAAAARMNAWTAPAKCVIRFAYRCNAFPAAGNGVQIGFFHTAGGSFISLYINPAGALLIGAGNFATATAGGASIAINTWNVIELQIDASGATMTTDWKVNGVSQTRLSTVIAASTVDQICFGPEAGSTTTSGITQDYDDLIVGSWTVAATDWYGNGKVLAQLPGSVGSATGLNFFASGDAGTAYTGGTYTAAYQMVDDPPGTGGWTATRSTTDNLAALSTGITNVMEMLPLPTAEAGLANAVRALISYSSSATQANLYACDVCNAANFGGFAELWGLLGGVGKAYNVTTNNFKGALVPVPAAGWAKVEVNGVRVRFGGCTSADISPVPTLQAWLIEVDWPVAAVLHPAQHHRRPGAAMQRRSVASARGQF